MHDDQSIEMSELSWGRRTDSDVRGTSVDHKVKDRAMNEPKKSTEGTVADARAPLVLFLMMSVVRSG